MTDLNVILNKKDMRIAKALLKVIFGKKSHKKIDEADNLILETKCKS